MFQPWRLKLKAAEEALRGQRLDEARELLCQSDLGEFLPAKQLKAQVADCLAQRGQSRAALGETSAGWRDLDAAVAVDSGRATVGELRQALIQSALEEAAGLLAADEPQAALDRLHRLDRRGGNTPEVRGLKHAALKLDDARRLALSGRFAQAEEALAAAQTLRPDLQHLQQRRLALQKKQETARTLKSRLHTALSERNWTEVLDVAEDLLELAPGEALARDARRQAWRAVGAATSTDHQAIDGRPIDRAQVGRQYGAGQLNGRKRDGRHGGNGRVAEGGERKTMIDTPHESGESAEAPAAGRRFVLWIDGVGAFLVCESDEVILGQPTPGGLVDVPILGDVSKQHAVIHRCGEGYLLKPSRPCRLDGKEVTDVAALNEGAIVDLGGSVRLRFRKPHPLSATARLEFVSRHRTEPAVDAVVLMAESCILGPSARSHIVCPGWSNELVLYSRAGQLYCQSKESLLVDGERRQGQTPITRTSQINGEDFSIALEEL